jgi:hypothetical protein
MRLPRPIDAATQARVSTEGRRCLNPPSLQSPSVMSASLFVRGIRRYGLLTNRVMVPARPFFTGSDGCVRSSDRRELTAQSPPGDVARRGGVVEGCPYESDGKKCRSATDGLAVRCTIGCSFLGGKDERSTVRGGASLE